ncbi:MAG: N-acetyltransferase family protein [Bacteroidales bacterium]
MKLRLAAWSDLKEINAIYNQAVEEGTSTAHLLPLTDDQREGWFRQHDPGRFPVFVTEHQGEVTGWVSLSPYRPGRQALAHVAEVSYFVERIHRGKGLGMRLLSHAVEVAPRHGFSVLIALLLSTNPASIRLLQRNGFSKWGTMPGIARIGVGTADHLYYGLKL